MTQSVTEFSELRTNNNYARKKDENDDILLMEDAQPKTAKNAAKKTRLNAREMLFWLRLLILSIFIMIQPIFSFLMDWIFHFHRNVCPLILLECSSDREMFTI